VGGVTVSEVMARMVVAFEVVGGPVELHGMYTCTHREDYNAMPVYATYPRAGSVQRALAHFDAASCSWVLATQEKQDTPKPWYTCKQTSMEGCHGRWLRTPQSWGAPWVMAKGAGALGASKAMMPEFRGGASLHVPFILGVRIAYTPMCVVRMHIVQRAPFNGRIITYLRSGQHPGQLPGSIAAAYLRAAVEAGRGSDPECYNEALGAQHRSLLRACATVGGVKERHTAHGYAHRTHFVSAEALYDLEPAPCLVLI
jgi:hypothetical protein